MLTYSYSQADYFYGISFEALSPLVSVKMDNGSDIEISDIEDQYPQAEIHRKLTTEAHVSEDRLASKKVWKQLEITFSSPTTQRRAAIWIKGWKAWITTSRKKYPVPLLLVLTDY